MTEVGKIVTMDLGDTVLCDLCNKDYTDSDEQGGLIFLSNAVCPTCTPDIVANDEQYNETKHIKATCPSGKSFAAFVWDYRGGPAVVEIQDFTVENLHDTLADVFGEE